MWRLLVFPVLLVLGSGALGDTGDLHQRAVAEAVARHRNLGKAFYENPATQHLAPGELAKALALAPNSVRERINHGLALLRVGKIDAALAELRRAQEQDSAVPHTWFNLGISLKQQSKYDEARIQLEGMAKLVPDEPITRYNLGVLYKLAGDVEKARQAFERAAELSPDLAGPHFQLAALYRQAGEGEEAKAAMARFREAKELAASAAVPEDLEWSWYSELLDEVEPPEAAAPPPAELRFEVTDLDQDSSDGADGLVVLDADGDGGADLLAWSGTGVRLFDGSGAARQSALEAVRGVVALAPGDFDDDGLSDLCLLFAEANAPRLYRNVGSGRFAAVDAPLPARAFDRAVWLDVDHDYDLDLLLLGREPALLRNQGDAGWGERSAHFPFVAGRVVAAATFDLVADSQGTDLVVVYADRPPVLYHDRLGGRYAAQTIGQAPLGAQELQPWDLDGDGWTDLVYATGAGEVGWLRNERGSLAAPARLAAAPAEGGGESLAIADLDARGVPDLVHGSRVLRNRGRGELDPTHTLEALAGARALVAADLDGDGRTDLAALSPEAAVVVLRNRTEPSSGWLRLALRGVKNLVQAPGAEVEVKAGSLYQKRTYRGVPLLFGLGARTAVETVRITWPNGLVQNVTEPPLGQLLEVEEAPRLSGSCPMIFTWDGEGFRFITDVLGVAPLGASAGDGVYFPVDHDEVVQIPGDALVARDGRLEVRITEELREVAFLDQVRLLAVDHAADTQLFVSDKFVGPPFPEHRTYTTGPLLRPNGARDDRGADVRELLLARDARYPDAYPRDLAGVGELHSLEVDLPPAPEDGPPLLVLSGWVDWADGSTFLGASQEDPVGLSMPRLEVAEPDGTWRLLSEDIGIPAGKPKTIVVELPDDLPAGNLRFRITTNLCVYWDEIALAADLGPAASARWEAPLVASTLRFRGFSRAVIHPERKQPERFVYTDVQPATMWNPTPGLYTRYGEVRPLLATVDDLLVVMGSGDEIELQFDAEALPPLAPGAVRGYLLWVDGWAKDGDANTAFSQSVEPLPFHGMPQYPYEAPFSFPDGAVHRRWREIYQTRPALRLLRPLAEDGARASTAARP